jgi:hypothetical protein
MGYIVNCILTHIHVSVGFGAFEIHHPRSRQPSRTMKLDILKPVAEWTDKETAQAPYNLIALTGPVLTGFKLSLFRWGFENPFTRQLLYTFYTQKNQMPQVRRWCGLVSSGSLRAVCCSGAGALSRCSSNASAFVCPPITDVSHGCIPAINNITHQLSLSPSAAAGGDGRPRGTKVSGCSARRRGACS